MNSKEKESLVQVFEGSHSVFLVTTLNWRHVGSDAKMVHGKLPMQSKRLGCSIWFSRFCSTSETSGGRLKHVPHFDHKAEVEEYIRSIGVPANFILPVYFIFSFRRRQAVTPLHVPSLSLSRSLEKKPDLFRWMPILTRVWRRATRCSKSLLIEWRVGKISRSKAKTRFSKLGDYQPQIVIQAFA